MMTVRPISPERFSARPIDDLADLSDARSEFAGWLRSLELDHEVIDDLLVVMSELGANAVRESPDDALPPTIEAEFDTSAIIVDVANEVDVSSQRSATDEWDLDDPLRTGGRGLLVVSALMDDVDVEVDGRRLHVRCRIAIDGDQDGSTVT